MSAGKQTGANFSGAPLSHGGGLWNTGDWTELPQGVLLREADPLGLAWEAPVRVVPGPFSELNSLPA